MCGIDCWFSNKMHPPWMAALVLGPTLMGIAEGCYRKATIPTMPPSTTPTSTINPSHRGPCTEVERIDTNCLNGGTCFSVHLDGFASTSGCVCPSGYDGMQCEQRSIDNNIFAVHAENMRTAHIAAGASVCILLVFIVLFVIYVYIRGRKKPRRRPANNRTLHSHINGMRTSRGDPTYTAENGTHRASEEEEETSLREDLTRTSTV